MVVNNKEVDTQTLVGNCFEFLSLVCTIDESKDNEKRQAGRANLVELKSGHVAYIQTNPADHWSAALQFVAVLSS